MKSINYIYYLMLLYVGSFVLYLIIKAGDNLFVLLTVELFLIYFCMSNKVTEKYFICVKFKGSFYDQIRNKESNNIILVIKKVLLINICMIFFNFDLGAPLLIMFIFDFIVKYTFGVSIIEYFYNREIRETNMTHDQYYDEVED